MKVFDFKKQLKIGSDAEANFLEKYPKLKRLDGYKGDFETPDGSKIELKADSYCPTKTKNFFIERYSDVNTEKVGGPWQADTHQCIYFVYTFTKTGDFYWFDTKQLLVYLNKNVKKYPYAYVPNKGWTGKGFLVPREDLKHLLVEEPKCLK